MISGKTALVGLLGQPVEHSISPIMHNAALEEMKLDWTYVPMPCNKSDLPTVLNALSAINCRGLNVTIPHKESVAKLCSSLSPIAKRIGAVNTLIPNKKGGWIGTNTDITGFLEPLKKTRKEWKGCEAIILGCGGSARAIFAGLEDLHLAKITIVGRTPNKLEAFLIDLKTISSESCNNPISLTGYIHDDPNLNNQLNTADLIVNATPVGMAPKRTPPSEPLQIPLGLEAWKNLNSKTILYDLIYTPRPTAWLALGNEHGCKCIDGLEMLVQQGAASLKLWSGIEKIPINAMRAAAKKCLSI